ARHAGGKLVLRIEDTDAARDSEESYHQILDALNWLGIDWDEGVEKGGPNEPYRQSQRTPIYLELIERLLDAGLLYESYVTPDEMEARNVAAGRDPKQGYDNFERELTAEQRAAFRAEGRQPALRLRVPDEDLSFDDLVRGPITFPAGSFTDFVVVRPNGAPLYTFVNPVDDALMGITHVVRGEDLLSSTPRQIAMYLALIKLGVTEFVPRFGHLPLVRGDGTKKLSKRDPESNLFHHRDRGFIPEGLLNYLALLGWSIAPDRDVFSRDEFVAAFDIADVNPNPASFDQKKADSINGDHIRMLAADDFEARLLPYLAGIIADPPTPTERVILREAAPLVQERITVLSEARPMLEFFFQESDTIVYEAEALPKDADQARLILSAAYASLEQLDDFSAEVIEQTLRHTLTDSPEQGGAGLKPRDAFGPLRSALSGKRISPPLFESMEILDKEATLARLDRFRSALSSSTH
ncbi:MAG: glutamate--tRNA ligase, partial [Rhodoglobus sp.]